jgi:hypothetical protein
MKFRSLVSLAVLSLSAPLFAQEGGVESVSLRIDFVSWGEDIDGLNIGSGEDFTALAFRYSQPVNYRGSRVLEISRTTNTDREAEIARLRAEQRKRDREAGLPVPEDDGPSTSGNGAVANGEKVPPAIEAGRKKNPSLVALVNLPSDSRRVTVLLAPGPAGTFLTQVIDDDPARLPAGRVRIHNFSPYVIALNSPGVPPKQLRNRESFVAVPKDETLIYELAYQLNGEWEVQENNLISVPPTDQVQMVVLQSDAEFFTSSTGSRGGFLQTVVLRRTE